jgi:monoamine oxidase
VEYGLDSEQQSALNFIDMSALGLSPTDFNVWGESDGRYQIKGGNNRLIDELTQRLDGQIHYLHRLEAIHRKGTGYRLTFENPNGNAVDIDADVVILTIPFSVLRQVALNIEMPPFKKRAIAELGYGTITKMMAGVKQRTWRARSYNGDVFTEDSFQQAYDNSRQQARQGEEGGITFYLGGQAGVQVGSRPEVEITGFLKELDQVFLQISSQYNDRMTFWKWPTFPFSLGAYSCYKVGQWTTIAGAEIKPVGNLLFAGEHCSQNFQGYMNGAAETGKQVAKKLMAGVV